jgi:tRNA threonylcarbamoyladenosine modification (KEOPS) complex Cgi121 subunit
LLKHIEEFGKYIAITGFRNMKIKDTEEFLKKVRKKKGSNVETQFFDAKYVATWQHLYFAVLNALTAFKNKGNISKGLAMETMLYASTQRQIRKAMELLGIKSETSEIALLIIGENSETVKSALSMISASINVQHDDTVLELSEEKRAIVQRTFGISDLELKTVMRKDGLEEALTDLVIERMALLVTLR